MKNTSKLIEDLRSGSQVRKEVATVVDTIVKLFHSEPPQGFSISEILMAGSFGKGTMIPNDSDVDLVIYMNNFDPSQYDRYIQQAKTLLQQHFKAAIKNIFTTKFSLQFTVHQVDIDILFGKAVRKPTELVQYINSPYKELMNASAAKFQVGFIR